MIPILPPSAWREFRGEPKQKGLNKTTHRAIIQDATGKLHHCYVKGCPLGWPTPLTEALGWLLAEALGLPRPEFAALVLVPLNKLRKSMQMDQHWLHHSEMLAFCASAVNGKPASQGWRFTADWRASRLYKRPEIARISAFDQWVDNQDRNTGNLIVTRGGNCIPIDNEYVLYSLLWAGKVPFDITHNSLLAESINYLTPVDYEQFLVDIAYQGKLHEAAFITAASKLQQMIHSLIPDTVVADSLWANVEQFLANRSNPHWLSTQLGVIV